MKQTEMELTTQRRLDVLVAQGYIDVEYDEGKQYFVITERGERLRAQLTLELSEN